MVISSYLKGVQPMITKEQAIKITSYVYTYVPTENKINRWKVNGVCKTWKTRPNEFRLPVKHGMYSYWYVDQYNAEHFFSTVDEALEKYPNAKLQSNM